MFSYSLTRNIAAVAHLIWLPLVSSWNNNAVHTSSHTKRKWETERGGGRQRERRVPHKLLLLLSWHRRGAYLVHFECQRWTRKRTRESAGDKGPTVGRRCTLYNDWIKVGRFGQGFLLPSVAALIQKLCSVYRECADIFSLQPLSCCHAITALDVTQ